MEKTAPREEERALVRAAREGDLEAFDRLVQLHSARLYNFTLRMLRVPEEAEDAAQEVFLRAFKSLRKFRGDASFSTWLHRLAFNFCVDQIKRRKRQPVSLETLGDAPAEVVSLSNPRPGDPAASAEKKERQEIIQAAIASLPEAQRAVIVLCDLQGMSYEECAQVLSTNVGTVKSRLNRARMALKEKLAPRLELLLSG